MCCVNERVRCMQLSIKNRRERKRIAKGIISVGGVIYAEKSKDRKVRRQKTPMQGLAAVDAKGRPTKELRAWQKAWTTAIENERWEEVQASRVRSASPTVAELIGVYRELAAAEFASEGEPKPTTADENARKLAAVARAATGEDDPRIDELTLERIEKWVAAYCAKYPPEQQGRARVSAWSTLAQARSVWAKWTRAKYERKGIRLPPCLDKWPCQKRNYSAAYKRPPEALRAATMKWFKEIADKDPALWTAAALMVQFAMRPWSAARLRWSDIEVGADSITLRYTPTKTENRTSRPRSVSWPVAQSLYDGLRERGGKGEYVTPGETATERYALYTRRLCAVMRGLGWDRETYGKACYELRKLCVDAVYRTMGVEAAVQISGDNVATIMKYYADPNRGRAAVDVAEMIVG